MAEQNLSELPIPPGPDGLTSDWLTAALRETSIIRTAVIRSVAIEDVGGARGLIGTVVRVRPTYSHVEPNAPRTFVAKFPPQTDGWVTAEAAAVLSRTEVRVYQELAGRALLPSPAVYFGGLDPDSGRSVLLIEDLGDYRVTRQITGCSRAEAALAVRQIANFHAFWWNDARGANHEWLAPVGESTPHGQLLRKYRGRWPTKLKEVAPRLAEHFDRVPALLGSPPLTIVHGDFHSANMFFGTPPKEREFVLFDFQRVALGRGPIDIARFAATSLQPRLRRSMDAALLRDYCSALEGHGVIGYGLDACTYDFRLGLLWDLADRLAANVRLVTESGREWPERLPIVERCLVAIDDWDAMALLPPHRSTS